jgi:hypothetical protein
MLFEEIIAVYSENQNTALLTIKADGTYSYNSALKVEILVCMASI